MVGRLLLLPYDFLEGVQTGVFVVAVVVVVVVAVAAPDDDGDGDEVGLMRLLSILQRDSCMCWDVFVCNGLSIFTYFFQCSLDGSFGVAQLSS
jgi:hypothetical protein